MTTEAEVRRKLHRDVGRRVPERIWRLLVQDSYVAEVIAGQDDAEPQLLERARRLMELAAQPMQRPRRRSRQPTVDRKLVPRMEAVSELLADWAETDPDVIRCRRLQRDQPPFAATEINRVAERLVKRFPWSPDQAASFLRDGAIPFVDALSATRRANFGTAPPMVCYTINVDPWVPVGTVARFYAELQAGAIETSDKPIQPRTLELVRWATRWRREHPGATWAATTDAWNGSYPKQRYADYRTLRRAYERGRASLLFPGYHLLHEEVAR